MLKIWPKLINCETCNERELEMRAREIAGFARICAFPWSHRSEFSEFSTDSDRASSSRSIKPHLSKKLVAHDECDTFENDAGWAQVRIHP